MQRANPYKSPESTPTDRHASPKWRAAVDGFAKGCKYGALVVGGSALVAVLAGRVLFIVAGGYALQFVSEPSLGDTIGTVVSFAAVGGIWTGIIFAFVGTIRPRQK